MKLSEFKENIIKQFGEKGWKQLEKTEEYLVYSSNEKQQNLSVKLSGTQIKYIDNPSEELQLEAIKNNVRNLQYIDNPTKKVQLEAVKRNPLYIQYINNPSEKILLKALEELESIGDVVYLLKYIENDLKEE